MKMFYYTLLFSALFVSCQRHYVQVSKVPVNQETLASTFARSPDPLQEKPPTGEKLYISWQLPFSLDPNNYHLVLSVIYKDLSEEQQTFSLPHQMGVVSFSLVDERYLETNGFYAYQVELVDKEGKVIDKWQHQMWVTILH